MNDAEIPSDAPPPYSKTAPDSLKVRNGIPPDVRRSMEDEGRSLPEGWVRQFDAKNHHHFYVDTTKEPYRSIWHHPYDDEQYLSTLSSGERERIQAMHRVPTHADIEAESTDDEDAAAGPSRPGPSTGAPEVTKGKKPSLGRKMKDKLTGTTHEERQRIRAQRAEEERRYYEQHMKIRQAMRRAQETGQPQLIGKDRQGHDLYVEPSPYGGMMGPGPGQVHGYPGTGAPGRYAPPFGGAYGGQYSRPSSSVYQNPNARFIRPQDPYSRPYYGGYGGGLGFPLAGGLLGGLALGGLLGATI